MIHLILSMLRCAVVGFVVGCIVTHTAFQIATDTGGCYDYHRNISCVKVDK